MPAVRLGLPPLLAVALVLATTATAAAAQDPGAEEPGAEYLDFSDFLTPTCELAGLRALPPAGWFNVSVQDPPAGHRGCQMMRTNEADELVGLMRLRSIDAAAVEFSGDGYDAFVADELAVLGSMGYVVGEPIWARDEVPVAGHGFTSGRAVGFEVALEDGAPHELHLLVFRGAEAKYLLLLATPTRAFDAALYSGNEAGFATLITTLQQPAG
jgi:hypothetical protein